MTIIEDTRNQIDKHRKKREWLENRGIHVYRSKLPVGDYALSNNLKVCIDTKKDLQELCGNVCQGHRRFLAEILLAKELEINLLFLCEHGRGITCLEDVRGWENPRLRGSPGAITGERLYKTLHTISVRHGIDFIFCSKEETGARILELLTGGKI